MKQILNLQNLHIVKIRASLERQRQYVATHREQCTIAVSTIQPQKYSAMWLFNMYLREN
jgi:hypothetical protein